MHDGLTEVLIFIIGLVGGWVLTSRSRSDPSSLESEHQRTKKTEEKRAAAKTALAVAKHEQKKKELKKKRKRIQAMKPRDLAAKVRELFGEKK